MDRIKRDGATSVTVALLLSAAVAMPVQAADRAEGQETAPPAGQRVEVPDLGIAVTWPDGWRTETEPPGRMKEAEDFTPVDLLGRGDRAWGGFAYARPQAKGSNFECDLQLYESTDLTLEEIADWFTQLESPGGGVEYEPAEVAWRDDLPAGDAVIITMRVDWFGTATTGVRYWIDGGDAIAMLGCGGGKPADAIVAAVETIAPTIEFLPDISAGQPEESSPADECVRLLLEAPIESAEPPEGWEWGGLLLGEYQWPALPSPTGWYGGLLRTDGGSSQFELFIHLACQPETDRVIERTAEVAARSGARVVDIPRIGDDSVALDGVGRSRAIVDISGPRSILWRNGDILGRVSAGAPDTDMATLETFARRVSDVLVASGVPTGTEATDDACVRRILEAPIETLDGYVTMGLYTFPTTTPSWVGVMPGKLPWSEPAFSLRCQPDAGLVMERAVEVEKRMTRRGDDGRLKQRRTGSIGDAAIAHERFESDAGKSEGVMLTWHVGDALGQIHTSASKLRSAKAFARQVSDLLVTDGGAPEMTSTRRQDACVQRLLDAPVERLGVWEEGRWFDVGLGWLGFSATWRGRPFFELTCQPEAELIMERMREAAIEAGETELDLSTIGDASFAFGSAPRGRWATLVWRNGDVLGRAYLGSQGDLRRAEERRALERFVRKVDALLRDG